MVSKNEKYIGSTLNPNAPIFSIGDSVSTGSIPIMQNENNIKETHETTPLILEVGTPDVSSENVIFDDDQESFSGISDTESFSELREPVPNPADSILD